MASTNTPLPALDAALASVPADFRRRLVEGYAKVKAAWSGQQYDAVGLRAGKFCEVVLRLLQEELTGSHTPFGTPITNFTEECQKLGRLPKTSGNESQRITIPRCLDFVYTVRNKRDVAHVGGDLDANAIDSATVLRCVDWCMCELLRLVHTLSLEEAQALLDSITEREIATIWAVAGKKRVLKASMTRREQVLLLLYSDPGSAVPSEDLAAWVEAPSLKDFRRDTLRPLHRARLIELDADTDTVTLSPTGAREAEAILAIAAS